MLINSRRSLQRPPRRLPKQSTLPSRQQLRSLLLESEQYVNSLVELPFGDSLQAYSLTVIRERNGDDCQWTLYRGEGAGSALEWSHASNDWEYVYSLIGAQFPGWDLKGKVLAEGDGQAPRADASLLTESGSFLPIKSTLEGDLRNLQVPNLLQSISMGKLTGRLQIKGRADTAMVFFVDGVPMHATMKGVEGDEAIIQLIGWDEGQFCFFPEPKTETKTVKKRLEFLIMEGCTFLDQYKSLMGKGLNFDAVVLRTHTKLTEKEFEAMVAKGTPIDVNLQKKFYVCIDNESSLFELLRTQQLSKLEWVPILFNLVNCGLIAFRSHQQHQSLSLKPKVKTIVDWSQMHLAEKALVRPDSGLYTFPAFLYFIDKEFCRYERFGRSFSIVLLKIGLVSSERMESDQSVVAEKFQPLPIRAIRTLSETIARIKRQIDVLAHYETLDYALLLPETNRLAAQNFINRLSDVLKHAVFEDIESNYVDFAIGLASIPEDCHDLETLISIAHGRLDTYRGAAP